MKIELKEITIRVLTIGYANIDESGVARSGKINIRPHIQREFIYRRKHE